MKKGKVGTGGREIMHSLYGTRGRPETNAYADLCAERAIARNNRLREELTISKTYVPDENGVLVEKGKKRAESPRTAAKWAKARIVHGSTGRGSV